MHFQAVEFDELPRLAWCARLVRGEPTVEVRHGPWVETGAGGFVEGAWNGEFAAGGFGDATAFMGSGASLVDEGILFATPTHLLERLHLMRVDDQILVSNSLPFVLARAGDSVDLRYRFYHVDLLTVMRGLARYTERIPTRRGNVVELFYHCNVHVSGDLAVRKLPKRSPDAFISYADYLHFLRSTIRAIHRNATAAERKVTYEPLATISSGYDSPAAALLAMEVGCRDAVTFRQARQIFGTTEDSGRPIADKLGLHVVEYDREDYLRIGSFPEAEFAASGTGGEEVVFAPLQDLLPRRLFFTGYIGDAAWDRVPGNVTTELRMRWPGGTSLAEFRLRVGFIHLPVPVLGYIQRPSLFAISNAPEMAPWRTGTDYDRPIPRRLLQERGVPGDLFGQRKAAITQQLDLEDIEAAMRPDSFRDLAEFARRTPLYHGPLDRLRFAATRALHAVTLRIQWRLERAARRLGVRPPNVLIVPERYRRPLGLHTLIFHWSVEKLLPRYAVTQPSERVAAAK